MKKNIPAIAIVCVLLLGVCVLLYPVVSAMLAKQAQTAVISKYRSTVKSMTGSEIAKMKADAQKYNESLYGAVLADPFSGGKNLGSGYGKLLNVGEVIGYLEIPKISVYLPIYHGTSEEILQKGVGHLENTSLPIGGQNTHAVLSGHRGLPSATMLTDLDQLAKGDKFYIHVLNDVLTYEVDQIKVVEPQNTSDLTIRPGKDYVTLVTCTPYGINTQRLLVRGERTAYVAAKTEQAAASAAPETTKKTPPAPDVLLPGALLLFAVAAWLFRRRRKKKG